MVIVELQGGDSCRIGLERQNQKIAHQSHMLGDILWDPVRWSSHIGFIQRWAPTLQFPSLARVGNPLLNIAYAIEILIEFTLVGTADLAT